ncbi:hypothetical protein [Kangiella sp.]|uniref:hypothetical protein n=1 Tax=Kangiella sp. TaxID=1920245 RepID=UPI003A922C55
MQEAPEEQYEQTRSPLELYDYWKMSVESLNTEEFLMRQDQLKRKYLEELPAITAIGLHWNRPGLEVAIKPHAGSKPYDAEISIEGWINLNSKIEVVSTVDYFEQLQRESIFNTGRAGGVASTHRRKGKGSKDILHEVVTRSDGEIIEEILNKVICRIKQKERKNYSGKYMLGVLFEHYKSLHLSDLKELSEKLQGRLEFGVSKFSEIYIINYYDLSLIKL